MGFRTTAVATILLIWMDVFCLSVRPSWREGGIVAEYVLLALHLILVLAEGATLFAYFSSTVWFTAGLMNQLSYTIRATLPLWVIHLIFTQMPWVYWKFISSADRAWLDNVYIVLFVIEYSCAIAFYGCFFYTMSCMTEKRMYAPYHRELAEVLQAQMTEEEKKSGHGARISMMLYGAMGQPPPQLQLGQGGMPPPGIGGPIPPQPGAMPAPMPAVGGPVPPQGLPAPQGQPGAQGMQPPPQQQMMPPPGGVPPQQQQQGMMQQPQMADQQQPNMMMLAQQRAAQQQGAVQMQPIQQQQPIQPMQQQPMQQQPMQQPMQQLPSQGQQPNQFPPGQMPLQQVPPNVANQGLPPPS